MITSHKGTRFFFFFWGGGVEKSRLNFSRCAKRNVAPSGIKYLPISFIPSGLRLRKMTGMLGVSWPPALNGRHI